MSLHSEEQKAVIEQDRICHMRNKRNDLLCNSDWRQLVDSPSDKASWAKYRQELRDITKQTGFPWEIVWPEEPA